MSKIKYIGLDGEMTSSELDKGGALIQLGLCILVDGEMKSMSVKMNPYVLGGDIDWSEMAEAVHGFTKEEVQTWQAPWDADEEASKWLEEVADARANKRIDTVAVGFNVGSFDFPFVKDMMPKTYEYFTRRVVDLNAIVYALCGNSTSTYTKVKGNAKKYAIEKIGYENAHDAGWDAMMHLYSFEYLKEALKGVAE